MISSGEGAGLPFTDGTGKLQDYFFPTHLFQTLPNIHSIFMDFICILFVF